MNQKLAGTVVLFGVLFSGYLAAANQNANVYTNPYTDKKNKKIIVAANDEDDGYTAPKRKGVFGGFLKKTFRGLIKKKTGHDVGEIPSAEQPRRYSRSRRSSSRSCSRLRYRQDRENCYARQRRSNRSSRNCSRLRYRQDREDCRRNSRRSRKSRTRRIRGPESYRQARGRNNLRGKILNRSGNRSGVLKSLLGN